MATKSDIEFKTGDHVTLRGWFFSAPLAGSRLSGISQKLPCLILSHGFSAIKEMDLDAFASHFSSTLSMHCLVYDQRGFGASDTRSDQPRQEIIPSQQHNDLRDAITYAQSRSDVDTTRIGIWGSSYSGGHVLHVGATDKRVKCVLSQVPLVDGHANFESLIRSDLVPGLNATFEQERQLRAKGEKPLTIPVVDKDPTATSALPTPDSFTFFNKFDDGKSGWKNEVTVRSVEALREYLPAAHIEHISPAPLLMTIAEFDVLCPTRFALQAYQRALEPKRLHLLRGAGHFDGYTGEWFERNVGVQTEFLREYLCN